MDRREHLSQMKASLQIKQETVEKQLDSILGESPSPSKQVTRADWTVVSPVKFAIKPDQVNQQQAEQQYDLNIKVQPVEESSQEGEPARVRLLVLVPDVHPPDVDLEVFDDVGRHPLHEGIISTAIALKTVAYFFKRFYF